jgi:hypothetical protein
MPAASPPEARQSERLLAPCMCGNHAAWSASIESERLCAVYERVSADTAVQRTRSRSSTSIQAVQYQVDLPDPYS